MKYAVLLVPFMVASTFAMQKQIAIPILKRTLSSSERREIARSILSTPRNALTDDKLHNIGTKFKEDNDYTCRWFKKHKSGLQSVLQPVVQQVAGDANVKMMGSRRWNTMHILSDIDAVVVTESDDREKVIDALEGYYAKYYSAVKQFRTKTRAGLYLFMLKDFVDPELGEMKLEYTIQSPATNKQIIEGMTERITQKFPDDLQKIRYAIAVMEAVYNNDIQGQLKLKEWTRVLSWGV